MEKEHHIIDQQLPLPQNFEELKKEGLSLIKKFGSSAWTNLNQSDPGVTILEQVCYALTELGYCGDFPIEDILTQQNGKINYDSQFYTIGDILTSSPVTIDDYRKLIVDNFKEVLNVMIYPAEDQGETGNHYEVYLYLDRLAATNKHTNDLSDTIAFNQDISLKVYILLNRYRNLGEFFKMPEVLNAKSILLNGTIHLDSSDHFGYRVIEIQKSLEEFVFSDVKQYGYHKLMEEGIGVNDLFNGPKLKNGWVSSKKLKDKREIIKAHEIEHLISTQKGVESVSDIAFISMESEVEIDLTELFLEEDSDKTEYIQIEIIESINHGTLKFEFKGTDLKNLFYPEEKYRKGMPLFLGIKMPEERKELYEVSSVSMYPELPKGQYREIDDYYSIQNTFPEVFPVGINAQKANQSKYQMAQSKQLIGYLSLFDQVLANQFAQLANVSNIFTFKNSIVENPFEEDLMGMEQVDLEKYFSKYPVPYLSFSPTYFYQTLYDVANIQPVLKRHNTYDFEDDQDDIIRKEKQSWKTYKEDAFNAYINGLKNFMEDEEVNTKRRNEILDHLLARHGESPRSIDSFIEGSEYTGNSQKDKIVFKSLYLQNLGLLSYYRMKGNNFIESAFVNKVEMEGIDAIMDKIFQASHTKNFMLNSPYIDKTQKLEENDFVSYSAIELKLNLLFGLSVQYLNFIHNHSIESEEEAWRIKLKKQALWFLNERKGLLMIETNQLLNYASFLVEIFDVKSAQSLRLEDRLGIHELMDLRSDIDEIKDIDAHLKGIHDNRATLESFGDTAEIQKLSFGNRGYTFSYSQLEGTEKPKKPKKTIRVEDVQYGYSGKEKMIENDLPDVFFFFPSYIPQFSTPAFQQRVELYISENLPIHVTHRILYFSYENLAILIPKFIKFHNSLIKKKKGWNTFDEVDENAKDLADFLLSINTLLETT